MFFTMYGLLLRLSISVAVGRFPPAWPQPPRRCAEGTEKVLLKRLG